MKKICLVLIIFACFALLFSQEADSLKKHRYPSKLQPPPKKPIVIEKFDAKNSLWAQHKTSFSIRNDDKGLEYYNLHFFQISPLFKFDDKEIPAISESNDYIRDYYQLPTELLSKFTNEELWLFCDAMPFISNDYNPKGNITATYYTTFNGFIELTRRPDFIVDLFKIYQSYKDYKQCTYQTLLLNFLVNKSIYPLLTDSQKKYIKSEYLSIVDILQNHFNEERYKLNGNELFYVKQYVNNYINPTLFNMHPFLSEVPENVDEEICRKCLED